MSFEFVTKLPTPTEIKEQYPVPEEIKALKAERDAEIADVITGKSDKLLVIIGPCSADNETAVLDYTSRLVKVQEKIKDKVIIIPRIFFRKDNFFFACHFNFSQSICISIFKRNYKILIHCFII